MKTLYIMRHGETLFNKQGKNQGWCDAPLTKLGIDQARDASFYFVDSGVRPDHFYSSTSERACDTLEIVMQEAWGQVLPYTRDKGLKEFNFGEYEGKDSYLNPGPPFGDYFVRFGGDSDTSLCERMVSTLTRIMSDPANEVVLATSHGAALGSRTAPSSSLTTTRRPRPSRASALLHPILSVWRRKP